jgi:formylglycine-generating enzyme required for sulfatase activity
MEDTMKRLLSILIVLMGATLFYGCIISKTPKTDDVTVAPGTATTFSVVVFPFGGTYTWTLDGTPLTNPGKSYLYTAEAGNHTLMVQATQIFGTDIQTWNIQVINLPTPISQLLNSMVYIPAGSFMMGSTNDEYGYAQYTTPVHQVTLQAFDIGAYEVTQAQYQVVMGTNPSFFQEVNGYPDTDNNPVEQVSWYDARAFCTALSAMTGRTFTLPSESQWEYACRAGTTTLYSYGDDDALLGNYAWYGNAYGSTHPVGTKLPNNWGLYDMMGNLVEWCLDSWHNNYIGAPTCGSAWEPETGQQHVLRGGAWDINHLWEFWSASRGSTYPAAGNCGIGFRVLAVP